MGFKNTIQVWWGRTKTAWAVVGHLSVAQWVFEIGRFIMSTAPVALLSATALVNGIPPWARPFVVLVAVLASLFLFLMLSHLRKHHPTRFWPVSIATAIVLCLAAALPFIPSHTKTKGRQVASASSTPGSPPVGSAPTGNGGDSHGQGGAGGGASGANGGTSYGTGGSGGGGAPQGGGGGGGGGEHGRGGNGGFPGGGGGGGGKDAPGGNGGNGAIRLTLHYGAPAKPVPQAAPVSCSGGSVCTSQQSGGTNTVTNIVPELPPRPFPLVAQGLLTLMPNKDDVSLVKMVVYTGGTGVDERWDLALKLQKLLENNGYKVQKTFDTILMVAGPTPHGVLVDLSQAKTSHTIWVNVWPQ